MVHGSWLKAQVTGPRPWALSHEPWILENRLINRFIGSSQNNKNPTGFWFCPNIIKSGTRFSGLIVSTNPKKHGNPLGRMGQGRAVENFWFVNVRWNIFRQFGELRGDQRLIFCMQNIRRFLLNYLWLIHDQSGSTLAPSLTTCWALVRYPGKVCCCVVL